MRLEKEPSGQPPQSWSDTIRLPDTLSHAKKAPKNNDRNSGFLTDKYSFEGYAWFGREFTVPAEEAEKDLFLFLERTRMTAVYIDGEKIGEGVSLAVPQRFALPRLSAGVHSITIRVGNVGYPTKGGHLTSPDTQTNWLGITGAIRIEARPVVRAEKVMVFPDVKNNLLRVRLEATGNGTVSLFVQGFGIREYPVSEGKCELVYEPDGVLPLWDEFEPNALELTVRMSGEEQKIPFGMREIRTEGIKLFVNGRETFLRGKHDGLVFPLTGYAPTEVSEWERVFTIAKSYGINHYRFHTCCPPEAAFTAADRLGIYLQPELPFWGTVPDEIDAEQRYLIDEGFRMLEEFGNHPSFVMMSLGNELWGNAEVMNGILRGYREFDCRHLYTDGSNNFQFYPQVPEESDFLSGVRLSRDRLYRGSYAMCDAPQGHIQTCPPNSSHNYDSIILPKKSVEGSSGGKILIQYGTGVKEVEADGSAGLIPDVPVISHEVGQYETYPDFSEISHYTGSIKAENIALYREKAEEKGLLRYAERFFRASGALAAACYKAEIETALRSENLSGFQLLDLQDFPGQGTALVGILNSLMESKGTVTPEEWRGFCGSTVVLAEFKKFVFSSSEQVSFSAVLFNTDPNFSAESICWRVETDGKEVCKGSLPIKGKGRVRRLGKVTLSLPKAEKTVKYRLVMTAGEEISNSWRFLIYPECDTKISRDGIAHKNGNIGFAFSEEEAVRRMRGGERVILFPSSEGKLEGTYCTDFWCYPMFRSISESMDRPVPIGTMGCLINEKQPALAEFPTEFYSVPEWYWIVTHSHCEKVPPETEAIVRVIDNPDRSESLALLYEKETSAGRLMVCTSRLWEIADNPEAKWLAGSLAEYLNR